MCLFWEGPLVSGVQREGKDPGFRGYANFEILRQTHAYVGVLN